MIKPKELRMGNWIKHLGYYLQVTEINKWMICCHPHWGFDNFNDIEGIPLTPEILEKAGFYILGGHYPLINSWFKVESHDGSFWFTTYGDNVEIKYLHQLQNLFYSLTRIELIINLKTRSINIKA